MPILSKEEVEARLKRLGAYWCADLDDYHAMWIIYGTEFTVPIAAPGATMHEEDVQEIEEEVRAVKRRLYPGP